MVDATISFIQAIHHILQTIPPWWLMVSDIWINFINIEIEMKHNYAKLNRAILHMTIKCILIDSKYCFFPKKEQEGNTDKQFCF